MLLSALKGLRIETLLFHVYPYILETTGYNF